MSEQEKLQEANLKQKLSCIQNELKAPKNQWNDFGKYHYRNCEDILESAKPICKKYRTTLQVCDEVQLIGERYYIKAIAKLLDWDSEEFVSGVAYARESLSKKGMDDSQITGATSSYARKYALNGLFNIDDTKDMDSQEYQNQAKQSKPNKEKTNQMNMEQANLNGKIDELTNILINDYHVDFTNEGTIKFIDQYNNGKHDVTKMNDSEKYNYIRVLNSMIEAKQKGSKK